MAIDCITITDDGTHTLGCRVQRIDILGTVYEIRYEDLLDADYDGRCDYTSKTIIIRNDNENCLGDFKRLQKRQLRHEIIHAFMAESGLQANWQHAEQFGHDETTVDWFAIQHEKIHEAFIKVGALENE